MWTQLCGGQRSGRWITGWLCAVSLLVVQPGTAWPQDTTVKSSPADTGTTEATNSDDKSSDGKSSDGKTVKDKAAQEPQAQGNTTRDDTTRDDKARDSVSRTGLDRDRSSTPAEARQNRASARELSRAFRDAAARAVPSVVTVKVRTRSRTDKDGGGVLDIVGADDASFDGFGSGVILSEDGLVLTNNHVVKDGKHIEVMLLDGRQYVARAVKADPPSDVAILRIDVQEKLPAAEIGSSLDLNVGDWVLAIGSPFNLHSTVSAGIISGKNRPLGDMIKGHFLQTDAAINPGNSGGPLIDLDGKVIGINTAISSSSGSFQGVGFAIPINRALWVKNELLQHGSVRRARMGAQLGSIPPDVRRQLGTPNGGGAFVVSVQPDRPAANAGLLPGDVIVSFDNQRINSAVELADLIEVSPIGQPLEIAILRTDQRRSLTITLAPAN